MERNVPVAGKYMPTHASKTKRLRMSVLNAEPGVVKADAIPQRMLDKMSNLDNSPQFQQKWPRWHFP